ncbi:MAG: hypothetical protein ABFC89_01395 [Methanospirillum sp.]
MPSRYVTRDGRCSRAVKVCIPEPLFEKARDDKVSLSGTLTAALVARYGDPWPDLPTTAGGAPA